MKTCRTCNCTFACGKDLGKMSNVKCRDDCSCDMDCSCGKTVFKVGDRVYSLMAGWGIVTVVGEKMVSVTPEKPGSYPRYYYKNGSYDEELGLIVLFHNKPTITVPKPKTKRYRYAYFHDGNTLITSEHHSDSYMKAAWDILKNPYIKLLWTEIEE